MSLGALIIRRSGFIFSIRFTKGVRWGLNHTQLVVSVFDHALILGLQDLLVLNFVEIGVELLVSHQMAVLHPRVDHRVVELLWVFQRRLFTQNGDLLLLIVIFLGPLSVVLFLLEEALVLAPLGLGSLAVHPLGDCVL